MIAERAVLECFYGPLWTPDERLHLLRHSAAGGATDYVYGPSADPRTGGGWREPYGAASEGIDALLHHADRLDVRVTWRVSPGAPLTPERGMRFADADDQRLLQASITDAARRGFGRVLVAFDDLAAGLSAADRAVFGHDEHPVAAAHAAVLNRSARTAQDAGMAILACPLHYWGSAPSRYRTRLAELLDPDIPVCWTGPTVTSRTITAADAATVAEQWQRPVWLWDNMPVNDWDGIADSFSNDTTPRRLPLVASRGREAGLADIVAGYGTNSALDAHLTVPATLTALSWAADPASYDADAALAHAATQAGLDPDAISALAAVAGATPADGRPGAVGVLVAALLTGSSSAAEAIDQFQGWRAALTPLTDGDAPAFTAWAQRAGRHLEAAIHGLQVLSGQRQDDGSLARLTRTVRDEPFSVAHHSVALLLDWIQGVMGAPDPAAHPDDAL